MEYISQCEVRFTANIETELQVTVDGGTKNVLFYIFIVLKNESFCWLHVIGPVVECSFGSFCWSLNLFSSYWSFTWKPEVYLSGG